MLVELNDFQQIHHTRIYEFAFGASDPNSNLLFLVANISSFDAVSMSNPECSKIASRIVTRLNGKLNPIVLDTQ